MNARKPTTVRLGLSLLLTLCATGAMATSASAATEAPGWQLSANAEPTNFVHGVDAVYEVTPEEATFTLRFEGQETSSIPAGAQPATVQAALEALPSVGAGNVAVSEEASSPGLYLVTFTGVLGNMNVGELEGTGASASLRTRGSASGTIAIDVFNVGAADSNGTITITDTLPPGVRAKQAGALYRLSNSGGKKNFGIVPRFQPEVWDCTGNGSGPAPSVAGATVVTCTNDPVGLPVFAGGGGLPTSQFDEELANPQPQVGIAVEAGAEATGLVNEVSIVGGGAPEAAATKDPITISSQPARGGLVSTNSWVSNADGTLDTQAGSHPYTATFAFNVATALNGENRYYLPGGEVRDLESVVPPGLVGDLRDMPQCRQDQLVAETIHGCPNGSLVGGISLPNAFTPLEKQVFNMVPPPGAPAELGFNFGGVDVRIVFGVKTGAGYPIVAHIDNIPQRETYSSLLTLWGVPRAESHRRWRAQEGGCRQEQLEASRIPWRFDQLLHQTEWRDRRTDPHPADVLRRTAAVRLPRAERLAGSGRNLGSHLLEPRRRRRPDRLHRLQQAAVFADYLGQADHRRRRLSDRIQLRPPLPPDRARRSRSRSLRSRSPRHHRHPAQGGERQPRLRQRPRRLLGGPVRPHQRHRRRPDHDHRRTRPSAPTRPRSARSK